MNVINVDEALLEFFEDYITESALKRIRTEEDTLTLGLVDEENVAIGALSGFLFADIFYITSIYVDPEYRYQGGGRLLIETLLAGLEGEEMVVCVEFMSEDIENDDFAGFLEAVDFSADEEELVAYQASVKAIGKGEIFTDTKYGKCEKDIYSFADLDKTALKKLEDYIKEEYLPMPEEGLFGASVDTDISVAHLDASGKLDAYVVMDNSVEYMPTMAGIYNGADGKVLTGMLRQVMKRVRMKYPMDINVVFTPVNEQSMSMIQKLVPEAKPMSYKYYAFA